MSWGPSAEDMCRACMRADGILLPMYEGQLESKNLPFKLAELTSVQIHKRDGLPSKLCAKCAYRTDAFYDFKMQVQATEIKLRKLLHDDEGSTQLVKVEVDLQDEDVFLQVGTVQEEPNALSEPCDEDDDYLAEEDRSGENAASDQSEFAESINQGKEADGSCSGKSMVENLDPETRNDVRGILKTEDSEYAIVYMPDAEEKHSLLSVDESYVFIEPESSKENDIPCASWAEEAANESEDPSSSVVYETKSKNLLYFFGKIIEGEDSETDEVQKPGEEIQNTLESEADDSDYFIDLKDNILGSLNDTIIKIKEIRAGSKTDYQCTLCMQNYEELPGALNHIVDNHVPATGPFFCTVCEKDCDNRRELRSHVKVHTGALPYVCFICQKAYSVKRYLKRHMVSHAEFYRHRCPKCGERFKLKNELETHVTSHIHGSPYACSQCPRVFNHKGNYKRHLITHLDPHGLHLPKFPCKICGKRFLNNRTLDTHIRVHTGEKPFKCNTCNKSFSQQGNLLNHMRIHSNPRSYTCEVCGKQFNQRSTLKDHSLLHTGEKPYVCTVCGIAFTFSAALRRHMWTHANGKPYGCEICDARFVGKYDLKRHMSIHSDRPRSRKRRTQNKDDDFNSYQSREEPDARDETASNTETILMEQVLLNQDVTQVVTHQEESEKENVDALFTLIQYGE